MSKISKLIIKNFRQIDELEIDFKGDSMYYSIAGRNRVGKTTILESIDLAFNQNAARYTKITESDFNNDSDIEIEVKTTEPFFLVFEDFGDRLIPCWKFKKVIKFRQDKERLQTFSSEFDILWDFFPEKYDKSSCPIEDLDNYQTTLRNKKLITKNQHIVKSLNFEDSDRGGLVITYGQASKESTHEIFGFKYLPKLLFPEVFYFDSNREKEIIPGYNTLISKIVEELEWRYRKQLITTTNTIVEDSKKLFENIKGLDKRESEIFTGASKILDENFGDFIKGDQIGFYPYNWNSPYSNSIWGLLTESKRIVPANKIGSGVCNLLALILSISFARVAKNPVIILIDEPELHLESQLKKNIFNFLKTIPELVIVSTHSPQFIDKEEKINNIIIENDTESKHISYGNALVISDLIFRLYGESIDDLFIPENVLIVEGKYDKQIILRSLDLLGYENSNIQILPAGSKDRIPDTPEQYEKVISELLAHGKWYSTYINKVLKIIVDEDVPETKIDGWVTKYGFDRDTQILRVGNGVESVTQNCFEYLYPKSLVNALVSDASTILQDDSNLSDKDFTEIISIILADEKKKYSKREQKTNRISKQRLTEYVAEKLTKDILDSNEGEKLTKVIKWIVNE